MKNLKMVLTGVNFNSPNLGCSALAYSLLDILEDAVVQLNISISIELFAFDEFNYSDDRIFLKGHVLNLKDPMTYVSFLKEVKDADIVIDFTEGDSFSDIYGIKRLAAESLLKEIAIFKKKKLVLGPQTIGPFSGRFAKNMGRHILEHAYSIFVRDEKSYDCVMELNKCLCPIKSTDIAFALKPSKRDFYIIKQNVNVGINISGLLWNGGYTMNNQFRLIINYQDFSRRIISEFLNRGVSVHLIPHVVERTQAIDGDYAVCKMLNREFEGTVLAPKFDNPADAKKYISLMDFFIGARMHSTIAAYSTGVPVVPISYSRKFEGLYASLGYKHIIRATECDDNTAYDYIFYCFDNRKELLKDMENSKVVIDNYVAVFSDDLKHILGGGI